MWIFLKKILFNLVFFILFNFSIKSGHQYFFLNDYNFYLFWVWKYKTFKKFLFDTHHNFFFFLHIFIIFLNFSTTFSIKNYTYLAIFSLYLSKVKRKISFLVWFVFLSECFLFFINVLIDNPSFFHKIMNYIVSVFFSYYLLFHLIFFQVYYWIAIIFFKISLLVLVSFFQEQVLVF